MPKRRKVTFKSQYGKTTFFRNDNHLTSGRCPTCGYIFDCATNLDDDKAVPNIGDISFCIKCGAVNQFDKHGVHSIDEYSLDESIRKEVQKIRNVWLRMKKELRS